nr:ribonuclease H-like domain-containing protein [Tanacetum cinerariifolium]
MNGHIADRCFKLVEYPPNFKKNTRFNKNSASNSANAGNKDHSPKNSFTYDQYKRLMALISDKSGSSSILANIVVGHSNGTKAVVTHVGSLRLTEKIVIHDVLIVPRYLVSLLSMHKLSKDNMLRVIFDEGVCVSQDFVLKTQAGTDESMSNEPNNDGRDMNNERSKDTNNTPLGGTKNTKCTRKDEGLLNDSTLEEAASGVDESVILDKKVYESEGDDSQCQEFKNVFQGDIPDSQEASLRRSIRKTSIPKKFSDFELGSKVKYRIDKQDLGKLKYFLGIEVLETETGITLNQRKYCLELLTEFSMLVCESCGTPIESKEGVVKNSTNKFIEIDYTLSRINNYQKLVEKLIYFTHTRPDISYDVHVLSQFVQAPMQSHLKLAFRVLSTLKMLQVKVFILIKEMSVYVDSDWAKCKVIRKSVTGYAVFMGKNLVSWKSKRQSMLSKSSTEAEYRAMNSFAIQIAANPVFHERTKHFEIELFFFREKVSDGVVKTVKVKSMDNFADIFTKGLSVADHNKFCDKIGLKYLYRVGLRGNIERSKPTSVSGTNIETCS